MNTPKKKKRFTREQIRDAIFAVHDGASKRDTAKEVRIPLTTLIRRLGNPFPSHVENPTAFTQDEEALFCGAGTTDVMCQAVVSYSILPLLLSYVWVNRVRIWQLYYIATCSDYFPSKNQIYLCGSFVFNWNEPNWIYFPFVWTELSPALVRSIVSGMNA